MDKKGAWVYILVGEEVVALVGIKEMYTSIPKNQLLVTIVEYISADGKVIPLIIIIPRIMIMAS
jgi:hypothetical protein